MGYGKEKMLVMTALNLSAAFHTINHEVLLSILQNNFGISGRALELFKNYLTPRDMTVKIGKPYSEKKNSPFQFPRGPALEQTYLTCKVVPSEKQYTLGLTSYPMQMIM